MERPKDCPLCKAPYWYVEYDETIRRWFCNCCGRWLKVKEASEQ